MCVSELASKYVTLLLFDRSHFLLFGILLEWILLQKQTNNVLVAAWLSGHFLNLWANNRLFHNHSRCWSSQWWLLAQYYFFGYRNAFTVFDYCHLKWRVQIWRRNFYAYPSTLFSRHLPRTNHCYGFECCFWWFTFNSVLLTKYFTKTYMLNK